MRCVLWGRVHFNSPRLPFSGTSKKAPNKDLTLTTANWQGPAKIPSERQVVCHLRTLTNVCLNKTIFSFRIPLCCLPVWTLPEKSLFKINREPFFFIIFIYSVQTQSEVSAFILFHGSLPGFTFTFRFSLLSELESLVLKISL